MQPLNYDIRSYYRKHQTGETEDAVGRVTPVYETTGPYSIAFRPGRSTRMTTEQGYTDSNTTFYCIADGVDCFESKDILSDGENDLYEIVDVQTWPTEQTFYVRQLNGRLG